MSKVQDKLREAIATVAEREAVYGENGHVHFAEVMMTLMGHTQLITKEDYARYHLLEMVVAKVCRYVHQFSTGGHRDSIHDAGNYCHILEVEDEKCFDHRGRDRTGESTGQTHGERRASRL